MPATWPPTELRAHAPPSSTTILASPYARARGTAALIAQELESPPELVMDERLRERELGVFDKLTRRGWTARHPEQAELRERLGKFYHRPPGGESWCDVVLRLRTLVHDLQVTRESDCSS